MRFTEHEMTTALHGYVKATLHRDAEKAEEIWRTMPKYTRFERLQMAGEVVLPVLGRLPDIDVPTGSVPSFTDQQVAETLEPWLEERFRDQTVAEAERSGRTGPDALDAAAREFEGWWREARRQVVREHVEFVQGVLAHLPVRTEEAQPADRAPSPLDRPTRPERSERLDHPGSADPSDEHGDLPELPPDFVVPDHL